MYIPFLILHPVRWKPIPYRSSVEKRKRTYPGTYPWKGAAAGVQDVHSPETYGVSIHGVPPNGWEKMEHPIKVDDLGVLEDTTRC